MKKKYVTLGVVCILLSLALFVLSFGMFHYLTDSGFTTVWQRSAGKPFVTEMAADLGVLFLFGGGMSLLISWIFFSEK